jgi:hypothetical protein
MTRLERAAVSAAAAALPSVAACGGSSSSSALPDCAGAGETIHRPAALPDEFRVPDGTTFVSRKDSGPFTLVEARAPGELGEVREFFERELDSAGFRLSGAEAEEGEAETEFAGNGVDGRLVLRAIGGCDGAVRVGIATRQEGT